MSYRTLAIVVFVLCAQIAAGVERRISIKVVVVTMFERGADTGDEPGEFQ